MRIKWLFPHSNIFTFFSLLSSYVMPSLRIIQRIVTQVKGKKTSFITTCVFDTFSTDKTRMQCETEKVGIIQRITKPFSRKGETYLVSCPSSEAYVLDKIAMFRGKCSFLSPGVNAHCITPRSMYGHLL